MLLCQNRGRNEHATLWIFREIAVVTWSKTDGNGSWHGLMPSFSEEMTHCRYQNIAGDDQATLMVDWNSASIAYTFRFYVCLRLQDRDGCSAAVNNGSCYGFVLSFFEDMRHCRRQKHRWRWPGNPNGRWNSANITYTFLFYVCLRLRDRDCCSVAVATDSRGCRCQKHHQRWPGSIEILHLPKCMHTRSSKTSRRTSFLPLGHHHDATVHCFFPTITRNGFVLTYEK